MSRFKKRAILIGSGIGVIALCLWGLDLFFLADTKILESYHLRSDVKEWDLRSKPEGYGYTNSFDSTCIYRTNIVVSSNVFSSVLRHDCVNFRNKGYLLATENRDIFWVGANGHVEKIEAKANEITYSGQNLVTNNNRRKYLLEYMVTNRPNNVATNN